MTAPGFFKMGALTCEARCLSWRCLAGWTTPVPPAQTNEVLHDDPIPIHIAGHAVAAGHVRPSWHDGPAKQEILSFVAAVTDQAGEDFVPPGERIAVFDNDGTLLSEKPAYFQLLFAIDRVKVLAPQHPEWKSAQPYKAVLENDMNALADAGQKGILELVMATHAGYTTEEFAGIVTQWLETAQHPRFKRAYNELVFQPMLELLDYLRANGFKTFIVSGGGIEFMRPWVEAVYGIPPEQVVGSSIKTQFELRDGKPALVRLVCMLRKSKHH